VLAAKAEKETPQKPPNGEDPSTSEYPVADVDLSEAPEHLQKNIREMLCTQSAMWYGALGTVHATENAIVTLTDAVSIRAQPYRTGPFKRHNI